MQVHNLPRYGEYLPDCNLYRSYCPICLTPMRVQAKFIEKRIHLRCERCRQHVGYGNKIELTDEDAVRPSWVSE